MNGSNREIPEASPRPTIFCPHCEQYLAKSTFYRHRREFYNPITKIWDKQKTFIPRRDETTSTDDFDMEQDNIHVIPDYTKLNPEDELSSLLGRQKDNLPNDSECFMPLEEEDAIFFDDNNHIESDVYNYPTDDFKEVWSEDEDAPVNPVSVNEVSTEVAGVVKYLMSCLIMWQLIFHVSDAAITTLAKIVQQFMYLLGNVINSERLKNSASVIPHTYKSLLNLVGMESKGGIISYVVCPECDCVYDYDSCFEYKDGQKVSKRCRYIAFPNHTQRNQRLPCGALLMKEVKLRSSKINLVPIKTYPYQSLKHAVSTLVSDPQFLNLCEHWRYRKEVPENTLADVYDARVWKEFTTDKAYLKNPGNLLLSLNVDWFQPFVHTIYSVGALYLVVLNLPRELRYKIENIILVGVIPGPKEPHLIMNSYITPLVQELTSAYKGWIIPTKHSIMRSVCIRLCIGCVVCDIPATRKLCGFLGHSARLGCSKCLKEFSTFGFGERTNFAGYNRDDRTLRSSSSHKIQCAEFLTAKTKTAVQNLETKYGMRYSALVDLPLYDPIRFPTIDPMHNLLLGTAKHMVSLWIKSGILTQQKLDIIQEKTALISFPIDVGRIPNKIGSSFSGFTADQWRTWTTIISAIVLRDLIPMDDLKCWLLFVAACRLLLCRIISTDNIKTADAYLVQFCQHIQRLYGDYACTPNMHLHMHLSECLKDYGPVYSFWCFPFERFNGILGKYQTNNKSVEIQIMKKFLMHQYVKKLSFPDEWQNVTGCLNVDAKGSLKDTDKVNVLKLMKLATCTITEFSDLSFKVPNEEYIKLLPPLQEQVLSENDADWLQTIYKQLYPCKDISFFSSFCYRCQKVVYGNDFIGSGNERASAVIMAYWCSTGSSLANIDNSKCQVGIVQYFIKHSIKLSGSTNKDDHVFCFINWKRRCPQYDWFGKSAMVSSVLNETNDVCCYMPIQRIAHRCASGKISVDFHTYNETVFVVSPISINYCI